MRKIIALLLVVVIAATTLSVMAFAASNSGTGTYKGKAYRCYVYCTDTYGYTSMNWAGTQFLVRACVRVDFHNRITGQEHLAGGYVDNTKFAEKRVDVYYGCVADCAIGTGCIDEIPFVNEIPAYPGR